ncbi:MAG: hypothetical protein KDK08_25525, partial [Rhizobiaceae bacterium]|nr:hypothetical protein [Rhizobiaceae bacterium]
MRRITFYSWQSDLPNSCNRGFIQTALEDAAANIVADDTIAVEPVVDRDTQNVPGSPDIAATIFGKIASAHIFVADVSIVVRSRGKRPTPNPNVLIELGYALRALGPERVILVFNTAFGRLEDLPFDLRMRRVQLYEMPEEAESRAPERRTLQASLEKAVRTALATVPLEAETNSTNLAVDAIENLAPNRRAALRRSLDAILKSIRASEPKKARDGGTAEELIEAITKTQPTVAEYSRICEATAMMGDEESALELYRWLGKIFDLYETSPGFEGRFTYSDYDFFKFLGHELIVTLVALLMREQQWQLIARVLDEPIPMQNLDHQQGNATWEHASEHLQLLIDESAKRHRISLHGDLLSERHSGEGGLSAVLPMQELMEADFFLFLLSQTFKDDTGLRRHYWRAWSCLYLSQAPKFVRDSSRTRI